MGIFGHAKGFVNVQEYILEMRNISKEFPGVLALDQVSFKVKRGEIKALVGENGAGKSTLMNVLCGLYATGSYTGEIVLNGQISHFKNISQSEEAGIAIIHQELALIPGLSIAENIFLGNEQSKLGVIDWDTTHLKAKNLLSRVGLEDDPDILVANIGVGKQQLVEIAKALSKDCSLLVLDEPTAALNAKDSRNLLNLLKSLQSEGVTSILISHKLNEICYVADSITVLRDGRSVQDFSDAKNVTEDMIIKNMVGRELSSRYPPRSTHIGEVFFEVKNWTVYHPHRRDYKVIDDVNMVLRKGEVVGLAGLMGAGRTEFAMSLFGKSYGSNISGEIYKDGKIIDASTVPKAIENGIAYLTEDRKQYGLILTGDIVQNISLTNLKRISKREVIDLDQEVSETTEEANKFGIKYSSMFQKVLSLSGGNQQRVILAKWMFANPDILILDEPTRGIDVGAKFDIYTIINDLASAGQCVLVISSELPELMGVCDRIYIMNSGVIKAEMSSKEATEESMMRLLV